MRFAAIATDNTRPLISAFKGACDVLALSSATGTPDYPSKELEVIAERNTKRRAIRYPTLYGFGPSRSAYRSVYLRKIRAQFAAIVAQMAKDPSRTALIFNGFLAPNALLDLAASQTGSSKLFIENGFFPGTIQADQRGINALSTLPRNAAFYDALSEADAGDGWPETFEVRTSKLAVETQKQTLPERFVFVPFQVPSDMQILALSPWIQDMAHLYNQVFKLARDNPSSHFVIKEHPSFPLSLRGQVQRHPNVHFANHVVTSEMLAQCEAVITVNSTVGLEALVFGKKVITLGNAHYAVDGLTLRANTSRGLSDAFDHLASWNPNRRRREAFIRFVFNRFLISGSRSSPGETTVQGLIARAQGMDEYSDLLLRHGA